MVYHPGAVARYFDALADEEWARLERRLQGRITHAIHLRYLTEALQAAGGGRRVRVLDAGSGPGRFAIDAIRGNAAVVLADLSEVQLELARAHIDEARLTEGAEAYVQADVVDLGVFGDASFDVALCYGGAISYARERHREAAAELARVVRPGGLVLVSVMSLYGTMRLIGPLDHAPFLEEWERHFPAGEVTETADVVLSVADSEEWHLPMAVFSSRGLRRMLEEAGLEVRRLATANPLVSIGTPLEDIEDSDVASARLMDLEVMLSDQPGLVDTGEHLIALARKPA